MCVLYRIVHFNVRKNSFCSSKPAGNMSRGSDQLDQTPVRVQPMTRQEDLTRNPNLSSTQSVSTTFESLLSSSRVPQQSMDSLHKRLERCRQMQTVLRAFEARDRNLLEDNLWRVSFWSCSCVLVMLCVALTQVNGARHTHHF